MKKFIILLILVFLAVLNSCTKPSIIEEINLTKKAATTSSGINGDWTLTKITGGFAGVNENFAGTVLYNFNTTTGIVTVSNNYSGTSIVNALPTGSYSFTLSGTNDITVDTSNGKYTITGNTLYIDDNVAADGFGYTFNRFLDCGTPDSCVNFQHAPVTSAIVPVSGNVNQVIPISLNFTVFNGCGGFGNITETNVGNVKTLTVNARYEGCICTLPVLDISTNYNFTATTTGIHTIKFAQPNGTFLSYSINIQ